MSRLHGDDAELTERDAALIKAMIDRGDKNETIAAYFGVNQRAISHVRTGKKFEGINAASIAILPPPGPYGVDPIYVRFYQTMTKVNSLWEKRKLSAAKELLERALKNPVFTEDISEIDTEFSDICRDEYGINVAI
ncbi:hypothetical protein HL653_06725 [Sphingomonas sp. AP4-R1]|uniref:hypothetical protein n=1 Tax=Sphingomonas sp. AP4-R1 TaxID=2735134 RepID=UPI0014935408|nr:hypothetical protein [Sphingomonas sp. AP4-R1]QJU56358.1 hypothetical protein HL653_06725 [Sphingomonas sp. AP4-R1]